MTAFTEFAERSAELRDLGSALGLLGWDQETVMPPKGAAHRAEQLSTLQAIYHERLTHPRLGELLGQLEGDRSLSEAQAASVRNLGRERARAAKLPVSLVKELTEAQSTAVEVWKKARKERNFALFAPHVERLVALRQKQADLWGHGGERYDALLEGYEPGMRTARLEPLLGKLRAGLVPVVQAIAASPRRPDKAFVSRAAWPADAQWAFSMELIREMGFDLEAGRQDRSTHPFSSGASIHDVRLTNRIDEANPFSSVFSALHEAGHGLYEQGFGPELHRTFATGAPSFGLHESQSRLWENLIGRSLPFWRYHAARMAQHFPTHLQGVGAEQIYATVNDVEPSLIRVEADEVTYNLHILLRFELELGLIRGDLKARDLPAAWNEKMKSYLGIQPPHDGEGVLQDIHWAWGEFGYFPTYSLGNLYSVCIMAAAERALPSVWSDVEKGNLLPVRDWLRANIHRHGFVYGAEELVQKATGQALSEGPFIDYLWRKYGELYGIKRA